jgi:hypothetical protein
MRLGRTMLARIAVVALLTSCLVAVVPGPANAGQLTLRKCTSDTGDDIYRGDGMRKLSVCSRGWVNGNPATSTRGVVELHTYALIRNEWVDSRSQSISLELARVDREDAPNYWVPSGAYGQEHGGNCRVNGPGGSVGCSVANVIAVDFYGPAVATAGVGKGYRNVTYRVSWRDDQGFPHTVTIKVKPYGGPLISPTWHA